jgi:hypothetical protein
MGSMGEAWGSMGKHGDGSHASFLRHHYNILRGSRMLPLNILHEQKMKSKFVYGMV